MQDVQLLRKKICRNFLYDFENDKNLCKMQILVHLVYSKISEGKMMERFGNKKKKQLQTLDELIEAESAMLEIRGDKETCSSILYILYN